MTIFNILDNIIKHKSSKEYQAHISSADFYKLYNQYMIYRWLSMCEFPDIISTLTQNQTYLQDIKNKELHYAILLKIIPQHTRCFLRYVK